jgi:tripartite-type tricarboxylate transporter receptor subunit TctC
VRQLFRAMRPFVIAAFALVAAANAFAQYGGKPIRLVVPFAPGGASDGAGRVIAKRLSELLARPVVVENRAGAGGTIGIDYVARAAPDGDTIVLVNSLQHVSSAGLFPGLKYDVIQSFRPIAAIGQVRYMLVVNKDFPAKDLAAFFQLVKGQPGKYTYGSAGIGSAPHLVMELFARSEGLSMVHVPYVGSGPAMTALLAGQIDVAMDNVAAVPLVKAGKLRALAISGQGRVPDFPDLPTFAQAGAKDFDVVGVWGFLAPAKTPDAVNSALGEAIERSLKDPAVVQALKAQGVEPEYGSAAKFGSTLASEYQKWSKLIHDANIKAQQ